MSRALSAALVTELACPTRGPGYLIGLQEFAGERLTEAERKAHKRRWGGLCAGKTPAFWKWVIPV